MWVGYQVLMKIVLGLGWVYNDIYGRISVSIVHPTLIIIIIHNTQPRLRKQQHSIYKKMHKPHTQLMTTLTILTLITACSAYSIAGPWKLQVDASYKNIDGNASIVFDFNKQIDNGSISSYLSVYACSVVDFSYVLADSAVSFYLKKIGVNRRDCVKDQVNQLIARMDKVTFTTTIGNKLLLLSPSGKILIKLTKIQTATYTRNITGTWKAKQIQQTPTSILIKANNSQIQLCNGNAIIDYKMLQANTFDVKVWQTKGCQEHQLLTGLYRSKYVRAFGDQLWFYGFDVEVLMKWVNLGDLGGEQQIVFQRNVVRVGDLGSNDTRANVTANQTKDVFNSKTNVPTKSKQDNDSLDSSPTDNITNTVQIITRTPRIEANPLPPPPALTPNVIKTVPAPEPAPTTDPKLAPPPPPIIPKIAPPPAAAQTIENTPKYLTSIKKEEVFTKWYLIGAPVQTMAVVTSNRIMVYGDCGVWFTLFNFKDPINGKIEIFNNQAKNTTPSCLDKNSNIKSLISNLKFLTIRQNEKNQKILSFWSKDNNIIGEWINSKQK